MSSLKALIDKAASDKADEAAGKVVLRPVVAPAYSQWLERNESERIFTPKAIEKGLEVMTNQHKVSRTQRFSASGLGQCPRRQLFSFAGYEQVPPTVEQAAIFNRGTAAHFWIMMEGLSAGWLIDAEVFYRDETWRVGGTLDGVISDASIWEYKHVAPSVYSRVSQAKSKSFAEDDSKNGPKHEHLLQLEAYELLTGMTLKSLFYHDAAYGGFHEYRLGPDVRRADELIELLIKLNEHEDNNTLPPMYDSCEQRSGYVYNECPFRLVCPTRTRLYD